MWFCLGNWATTPTFRGTMTSPVQPLQPALNAPDRTVHDVNIFTVRHFAGFSCQFGEFGVLERSSWYVLSRFQFFMFPSFRTSTADFSAPLLLHVMIRFVSLRQGHAASSVFSSRNTWSGVTLQLRTRFRHHAHVSFVHHKSFQAFY